MVTDTTSGSKTSSDESECDQSYSGSSSAGDEKSSCDSRDEEHHETPSGELETIRDTDGEKLYRLDHESELWRTQDGKVIYWEVHRLSFDQLTTALWEWSKRGLDQTQRLYLASLHPPHAGHRPGVLDFFCTHRQKLVRDHIQRIYSDLYLILRTWYELLKYLDQLNADSRSHKTSKTLKKIENRLTFHFMVALREYDGLPLDPKHPDRPSWPGKRSDPAESRLELGALSSASSSKHTSEGSIERGASDKDSPSQAICCHCHEVLEVSPTQGTTAYQPDTLDYQTSAHDISARSRQSERARSSSRRSASSHPTSASSTKEKTSSTKEKTSSTKEKTSSKKEKSSSKKEKSSSKEKTSSKKEKASLDSTSSKSTHRSPSPYSSRRDSSKASRYSKRSKSTAGQSDHSSPLSLMSFDTAQFSNTLGIVFHLR